MFTHAAALFLTLICVRAGQQHRHAPVCQRCNGTMQSGSVVQDFCVSHAGRIADRCCWTQAGGQEESIIIGLDFSNCSLSQIEDLHEASTAVIIDLSANPMLNISDGAFHGFTQLNDLTVPFTLPCPGGNAAWDAISCNGTVCHCVGQKDTCRQAGNMSWDCPEYSLCAPDGPGLFQCSCAGGHHGYKCLREGEFPLMEVLGILGAATVVVSVLLWATQRRKAKPI